MEHTALLLEAISKENLKKAFDYAVFNREKKDRFYNQIEINYAVKNKERIIDELLFELKDPLKYKQRTAFCYYPPKSRLTFRRMIYIPIKDLIVRYSFCTASVGNGILNK